MRSIIFLIMLCACLFAIGYSQTKKMSDIITKEDIALTENKIMTQFKKTKCYDKNKNYSFSSHIFELYSTKPRYKENFLDRSFVNNLEVCYTHKKVYPKRKKDTLYIEDGLVLVFPSNIYSEGCLVGSSDGRQTGCVLKQGGVSTQGYVVPHRKAIEYFNAPNLIYFVLNKASIGLLFAFDEDNNIFVINTDRRPFELCPLKKYVEEYWDEGLLQ